MHKATENINVNCIILKNLRQAVFTLFKYSKPRGFSALPLFSGFYYLLVAQNFRVHRIVRQIPGYVKIQIFRLTNLRQRVACTHYLKNLWSNEKL